MKNIIIILIEIMLLIVAVIYINGIIKKTEDIFNINRKTVISSPNEDICIALNEINPYGFNIIFYPDDYENLDDFLADVKQLIYYIKKTRPFDEYEEFNFFVIKEANPEVCVIQPTGLIRPILKCALEINKYFSYCNLKKFKAVILTKAEGVAMATVSSLMENSIVYISDKDLEYENIGNIFLHEFGHAFGLKDEVVEKNKSLVSPHGKPNCAADFKTAQEWWGDLVADENESVGYFEGCAGYKEYIKPHRSSLMNNLEFGDNYGLVSEQYMRDVLRCCFSSKETDCDDFFTKYPELKECKKV